MAKMKLTDTWRPYRKHCQLFTVKGSRFGLMWSERAKGPRKHPFSYYPIHCSVPGYPLKADQKIFKLMSLWWARGWGYHYDPYPPEPRNIDKEAWKNFAAEIDFYITATQTVKLTGFKAFMAWNLTALSVQFLRIQVTTKFVVGYPYVQWPNPPAQYVPLLLTGVKAWVAHPWNYPSYTPIPQPPQVAHLAELYATGKSWKGHVEQKHPLVYLYTNELDEFVEPPYMYKVYLAHWYKWGCYGPGYVTPGLRLVHWPTGSPGNLVTGDPIWVPGKV